jgi:hypothetical protein
VPTKANNPGIPPKPSIKFSTNPIKSANRLVASIKNSSFNNLL